MSNPFYDELAARYGDVPEWTDPAESTPAEDLTHDDYLVRRTDNGLRPEDAALEQPPQDPDWRPDGNG